MAHIHLRPSWQLPERAATPESVYVNRRQVLASMGYGAAGLAIGGGLLGALPRPAGAAQAATLKDTITGLASLNAKRNPAFAPAGTMTPPEVAAQYNNFYEFSREKDDVWSLSSKLTTRPWTIEVTGMVDKPRTFDVDDLLKRMPIEERVYRFRCVEAWSMIVPWVGFPLSALLKEVSPKSSAKFVAMTTFMRPEEAPNQRKSPWFGPSEPWPYTEGLTVEEANNDLAMLTVGIYGHVLPNQHGAPIRLIVPWKYGFKNIKSIVKMELTDKQPATFWNTIAPHEYGFYSNVNPAVPHPRWSQAFERDIGTRTRKPTLPYNGYAEQVAGMYRA